MGIGLRAVLLSLVLVLSSVLIFISSGSEAAELNYTDSIVLGFDEYWMSQEIGPDRNVTKPLNIHWFARDPNGLTLLIDLHIKAFFGSSWVPILESGENTGSYVWDLSDPFVPDGDYILKVLARNHNGEYCYNISTFSYHIHNNKRPDVRITTPMTEMECSGKVEVEWEVSDRDHQRYMISSVVLISPDNGMTFQPIFEYREDPGWCIIDTTDLMDGDQYRLRIEVEDPTGLKDWDMTGRFYIYNNERPEVDLTFPPEGKGLFGTVKVQWDSFDRNEERERLRVDLWYVTVHDEGRYDILKGAYNGGSYNWDTSDVYPGPEGHRLFIQLSDSVGERSSIDSVLVWIYRKDDPLILDPQYPRGTVKDNITITWETSKPAMAVCDRLSLMVYHREPGSDHTPVALYVNNTGSYSIDVSSGPDGYHQVRIIMLDPTRTWIYDEFQVDGIRVYHEMEPLLHIREAPLNGTNVTELMTFEVAGFDGNGDILTYIGLYRISGGGWTVFDKAYGGYKQRLVWNTTGLMGGDYEVRIAVYDGSEFNMSTSRTFGPFYLYESRTPDASAIMEEENDPTFTIILVVISVLALLLSSLLPVLIFVIRRDRKRLREGDMDSLRKRPDYVQSYLRKTREGGFFERLLPSIGKTSATKRASAYTGESTGLTEDDKANLEGYLDMLDPDLVDDVTEKDIDSYEVLGVSMDATEDEIREKYREFVRKFHPDKFVSKRTIMFGKAEEEFRKRNRARAILLDHRKRAILDRMLRESEGYLIRSRSMKSVDQIRMLGRK